MRLIPVLAWAGAALCVWWSFPQMNSQLDRIALLYFVVQAVICASAL